MRVLSLVSFELRGEELSSKIVFSNMYSLNFVSWEVHFGTYLLGVQKVLFTSSSKT